MIVPIFDFGDLAPFMIAEILPNRFVVKDDIQVVVDYGDAVIHRVQNGFQQRLFFDVVEIDHDTRLLGF